MSDSPRSQAGQAQAASVDLSRAWDGPLEPGGPDPERFEVGFEGGSLAAERLGEGPPVVLVHGLSAARRYVVHGSRSLPRAGYRAIAFDGRGHGSSDPAPEGHGYDYSELCRDLEAVLNAAAADRKVLLVGHSMGAHTAAAYALANPERVAAVVLIGPTSLGMPLPDEARQYWEGLASALEREGIEGFVQAVVSSLDPAWRQTVEGFTRARMSVHRDLAAVARALRELPPSIPFEGLGELEFLELPALVVASRDEADPGHPYSVGEEWSRRLPAARLIGDEPGSTPLAWKGGRLSRELASFFAEPAVRDRL